MLYIYYKYYSKSWTNNMLNSVSNTDLPHLQEIVYAYIPRIGRYVRHKVLYSVFSVAVRVRNATGISYHIPSDYNNNPNIYV